MAFHPFAALLDTPAVSPEALVSSTPQVSPAEMETYFPALGEDGVGWTEHCPNGSIQKPPLPGELLGN